MSSDRRPLIVAPSVLSADFGRLAEEVAAVDAAVVAAGAGAIVAGSAIFGAGDYAEAIAAIRRAAGA
jgi:pentose-5-phosphate-3-epimerase